MSRSTKIIAGIGAGALAAVLLCIGMTFFSIGGLAWSGASQAIELDVDQIAVQAAEIAHFQALAGFSPEYLVSAGGFTLVSYSPDGNHSHLMFVQAPKWLHLDQQQFEQQLAHNFGVTVKRADNGRGATVERRTLRIAGQPVEFAMGEGINSEGEVYRTMAGVWNNPNGQVLIYIEEPVARWNQAEIDAFIATIE